MRTEWGRGEIITQAARLLCLLDRCCYRMTYFATKIQASQKAEGSL